MKKIVFIVEKSDNGYGAYSKHKGHLIATMGDTIEELHANMIEAFNLAAESNDWPGVTIDDIILKGDYPKESN